MSATRKKSSADMSRTHEVVSRRLVTRYVMASEARRAPASQHSAKKLRHDISALRCELRDILSADQQTNKQVALPEDLISFNEESQQEKLQTFELQVKL